MREIKVDKHYLQKLNTIIDCPCGCRNKVKEELLELDALKLAIPLKLQYNYLLGKYYFHESKIKNKIENLEAANERFNNIFVLANSHNYKAINNPKYFFKASHTKYELHKCVDHIEDKADLKAQALKLCKKGLEKDRKNTSLLWLKNEIENN